MSLFDGILESASTVEAKPARSLRFGEAPTYYEPGQVWLYGNVRLLDTRLAHVESLMGVRHFYPAELNEVCKRAEDLVLDGKTLVCGVHNEGHMRAAIVPLRWGSPRIVIFSGGFKHHLGDELKREPFSAAALWRYEWDPRTDLAVSRRAPDKKPTYALYNPTVDRLVGKLGAGTAESTVEDPFGLRMLK